MISPYRVTIDCGLCTAKISVEGEDDDAVTQLVEQQALAAGFLPLPAVRAPDRRRHATYVCKGCAADIAEGVGRAKTLPPPGPDEAAASLTGGRAKQRPTGLPTLDAPGLPDGLAAVGISADGCAVTGLFAGLTQDEIAEIGPYAASIVPRPHG